MTFANDYTSAQDSPALVLRAIRAVPELDCQGVAAILRCLASKMKDNGFGDLDLTAIDEACGFITGESA